ncbi:NAD(P)-dependent oxidoreductase [Tersicoccus sp. Bi-70]|uniref:NAD(P)-dependent oxidoreductase n=1 Tax=Tersicoccus sp. Bi-70 TaxID=1897634 RepID=UPI000977FC15|nr:NAD(P)-dependent oxidoreductase [Tersicoccus sp. Bi-70]OMH34996.1 oxidoreductase [Tersicoccus sp. Bi-70]
MSEQAATHHSPVGFIGLGTMGAPMARNLAAAGYPVVLHDADPAASDRLAEQTGGTAASGPADFAGVQAIVTMLPTSRIVASALLDWDGGIPPHLAPGTVVIDMSSSDPTETVLLGERLASAGAALVDAPVSGGVLRAEDGTLSIMLGGDDEDALARAVPVVEAMSARIFRTGRLGSGHAMKALNNFVAAAATTAACEALIAGERFGLDQQTMVDVFNASTGQSWVTTNVLGQHVVSRTFASGFALGLYAKDVGIARHLTEAMDHPAPVCHAVSAALDEALTAMGDVDHTRAMTHWEHLTTAPSTTSSRT